MWSISYFKRGRSESVFNFRGQNLTNVDKLEKNSLSMGGCINKGRGRGGGASSKGVKPRKLEEGI